MSGQVTEVYDPIFDDVVYVDEDGRMVGFVPRDEEEDVDDLRADYAEGRVYDPFGAVGWADGWDLQERFEDRVDDETARYLEAVGLGEDD